GAAIRFGNGTYREAKLPRLGEKAVGERAFFVRVQGMGAHAVRGEITRRGDDKLLLFRGFEAVHGGPFIFSRGSRRRQPNGRARMILAFRRTPRQKSSPCNFVAA